MAMFPTPKNKIINKNEQINNNNNKDDQRLTDRNVELYPQFFLELITTQLRFYMVSPQLSLLIILTMQSTSFTNNNN